ncbi:MAG: 16S rRNA (uracil(1498)-N(3))-methyltransferase [Thiohalocapsa sp.]
MYTAQPLNEGRLLTLEAPASRHLALVLRLGAGDELILFNGDGQDYRAYIEVLARDGARIRIGEPGEQELSATLRITLALGVSKGERMDFALQKAVELGVCALQPLFTERSVVRLRDDRLRKRVQHWGGIIVAACEQSGRRRLPTIADPLRYSDWLEQAPRTGLLLDHRSSRPLTALAAPTGDCLTLLVGPEGGLAQCERDAAARRGFVGVRLGPRVMRTETAPLAAIAAIQALWGDFRRAD